MFWIIGHLNSQEFLFTVDRLEPPWAVVEWQTMEISHLPIDAFPINYPIEEGAHYRVKLKPSLDGLGFHHDSPLILKNNDGFVALPSTMKLSASTFSFYTTNQRDTYACSVIRHQWCYSLIIQPLSEN